MKLPSVRVLVEGSRRTLARFTVVLAVALLGTIAALILAERTEEPTPWQDVLIRILMSASLGISLVTAFAVAVEKQGWSRRASLATQLGGILLLAGYYVTLPAIMTTAAELHFFRFAQAGLPLGYFSHTIIDAHIYVNHVDGLMLQLTRTPKPLPRLQIASKPLDELQFEDFTLIGYECDEPIKFEVAV